MTLMFNTHAKSLPVTVYSVLILIFEALVKSVFCQLKFENNTKTILWKNIVSCFIEVHTSSLNSGILLKLKSTSEIPLK